MRTIVRLAVVFVVTIVIVVFIMNTTANEQSSRSASNVHVILIGASIGQGWHLAEWPTRMGVTSFTAESIPAWQFDKSEAVDEVLLRPRRNFRPTRTYLKSLLQPAPKKPGLVILKECSSYFPGDLATYQKNITNWVGMLREKQIAVALATVVPVTQTRAQQNPGKQEALVKYNEWVRQYTRQQGLILLDLETALRTTDPGRYLKDEFAVSDGTHLNAAAYSVLDSVLRDTLLGVKPVTDVAVAQ